MTTPRVADLPAGFRFHPTDEELVVHYLANQAAGAPCPAPDVIAEANIYACDPWELKLMIPASAGGDADAERYFFSPRERKYPNGARPNRAAGGGYWKATGTDRPVLSSATSERVGVKKALVFYSGRPPRGVKTGWIMHEYRLTDMASGKSSSSTTTTKRSSRGSSRDLQEEQQPLLLLLAAPQEQEQEQEQEPAATLALASSPKSEALDHQATMTKSCSITDLLNTIDGCALSQMLLLLDGGGPEEVDAHDAEPLIYYPPHKEQQHTRTISH